MGNLKQSPSNQSLSLETVYLSAVMRILTLEALLDEERLSRGIAAPWQQLTEAILRPRQRFDSNPIVIKLADAPGECLFWELELADTADRLNLMCRRLSLGANITIESRNQEGLYATVTFKLTQINTPALIKYNDEVHSRKHPHISEAYTQAVLRCLEDHITWIKSSS